MTDNREVTEADLDATLAATFGYAPPADPAKPAKSVMTLAEAQDVSLGAVFNRPGITPVMVREADGVIAARAAESDREFSEFEGLAGEVAALTVSRLGISEQAARQRVVVESKLMFESKGIAAVLAQLKAQRARLTAQVPLGAGRPVPGPAARVAENAGRQGPAPTAGQLVSIQEAFNARLRAKGISS